MTSDQPGPAQRDDAATTRRGGRGPRRAVRTAGTVGTDEAVLRTTLPAVAPSSTGPAAAPRGPALPGDVSRAAAEGRAPAGGGTSAGDLDGPAVPFRSRDDSDLGWGDATDSNDDRLRRDRPPHW